jgi:hypothetical protein
VTANPPRTQPFDSLPGVHRAANATHASPAKGMIAMEERIA